MDELPVVLHVGAPKAGSSALQYDLTRDPRRPVPGRPGTWSEYVAIDAGGRLLRGDALDAFASLYAARYCASADLEALTADGRERLADAVAALAALRADGTIPVLSYELWLHSRADRIHAFTRALAAPVHVVVYVRDPVSWLRSRYWQRRGRIDRSRADWIEEHVANCRWVEPVARWQAAPGVVRVDVRLADRPVPHDFASLLGFTPPRDHVSHNPSVPGEMARYLERHALSPEIHVSEAKFAWSRWTGAADAARGFDPPPATFDADDLRMIIERSSAASAALLASCDDDVRSRIVADARWWSADPEVHAGPAPRHPRAAPVEEADRLLDAGLRALVAADGAWRAEERRRRLADAEIVRLEALLAAAADRGRALEARLAEAAAADDGKAASPGESRGAFPSDPSHDSAEAASPTLAFRRRGTSERLRGLWRRTG